MSLFLTTAELQELTGRKQAGAQERALAHMGITCRRRPDGSVVVLRSHVDDIMGGSAKPTKRAEVELNWETGRAAQA